MKTMYSKIVLALILLTAFMACDDEQVQPVDEQQEVSTEKTSELVKSKGQIDNIAFNLFSNGFKGNESGRKIGTHRFSHFFSSRAEAARTAQEWDTCALITITENGDGTYTIILDFGEGCEESDGRILKGVVAFRGSETDTSGVFQVGFENFSEIHPEDTVENDFALTGWYHGEWRLHPAEQYIYAEGFATSFELNYENGDQEALKAEGELLANNDGFAVTKYNFEGTNVEGDIFSGVTVDPLIYNYSCTQSSIYTKGTEVYSFNGKSASVDFGDGTCDNILTIQADGITIVVNLDEVS